MSKLDEVRKAAALGGRPGAFPPGMDPAQAAGRPARLEGVRGDRSAALIGLDRIIPDPDQPRTEFDPVHLERLARSLKERGQLQSIRVRWVEDLGMYAILAGERRWRAARMAGLRELQCVVHDAPLGDADKLALQLVENALRDDLKPVEQARAYRRLMDARGWTMTELAAELALHQTTVSRALALLDLPASVQEQVEQGGLAPSAAAEIAKLDSPEDQVSVAAAVEGQGLARDDVAAIVRAVKARKAPSPRPEPVELDLGEGCTVQIRWKRTGGPTAVQALRKALKALQDRERSDDQAA
jgi:ParB family chromosome partitioning protein